jgi:alanyl-tRNA synthetase
MTPNQLRDLYLDFFASKNHVVIPSASLVPENDPTTLFTGSGMQPLVPYLLGQPHPEGKLLVNSQRCFRSQDIEEVGDNRHTTFFEMLGNWSLGSYFKEEQLAWFFEFLTEKIGIDPKRLFVTVFEGNSELNVPRDEQSVKIWQEIFAQKNIDAQVVENASQNGMQDGRIFYYDQSKNWWSRSGVPSAMPAGEPGGPDSEVFYDFGEEAGWHQKSEFASMPCHVNCDCGRFLEIGNSVFMQYQKQEDGSFQELAQQNVDFGGGFERFLAAHANQPDIFKTELFTPIIEVLQSMAGVAYSSSQENDRSYRVIADHLKSAVMLASDGVYPGNKAQGYFSRRLIRRAIRYAKMIGINQSFVGKIVPVVCQIYNQPYPKLLDIQEEISGKLVAEEEKFERTLEKGLREIDKITQINGEIAFKLYETYGFPFELTQEIANEKGQKIDLADFESARIEHANASRTASAGVFKGGLQDQSQTTTQYHTATHLLHAALRQVLGDQIEQRGSHITVERLRFDFACPNSIDSDQLKIIEGQINQWITADLPVIRQSLPKEEALSAGALAFFREKYPEVVSVYTIGNDVDNDWISKELCGGPHVKSTSEIGQIEVFKEKSIGAGVRRIYVRNKQL